MCKHTHDCQRNSFNFIVTFRLYEKVITDGGRSFDSLWLSRKAVRERIVYNKLTNDNTIALLATRLQRRRALPISRRGAWRQFRSECPAHLPPPQDPEASAISAQSTTSAFRDAAHHG